MAQLSLCLALLKDCGSSTGVKLLHTKGMLSLVGNITSDRSHVVFEEFQLGVPQAQLTRLRNSFVRQFVKLLNQSLGSKKASVCKGQTLKLIGRD